MIHDLWDSSDEASVKEHSCNCMLIIFVDCIALTDVYVVSWDSIDVGITKEKV